MTTHQVLHYLIAAVWLANGLFCKVLNLVPRHQQIVARILGKTRIYVTSRISWLFLLALPTFSPAAPGKMLLNQQVFPLSGRTSSHHLCRYSIVPRKYPS